MGCNISSENEDQEEVISPETREIISPETSFSCCGPYENENTSDNETIAHNIPENIVRQQPSVSPSSLLENFKPLKACYFGPVLNLTHQNVLTNELIQNLIFGNWKPQTAYSKPNIVNIPFKSEEGKAVINIFSKTSEFSKTRLVITGISRIENVFLYASYLLKKEEMLSRNGHVDELNLFHGTKKQNVLSICNDNFDWRRYGDSVGNRFGKGVSFTPKATYAAHYCDEGPNKVMFLAKVLVSKAMIGNENMLIPVDTSFGKTRHNDTSVKQNIDVVVKYGDNEFYPAYKISFNVQDKNGH